MTAGVVGVLAEALAAKLTEELGWDWEGERFEGVCMRGGSVDVPSGEQVIRELSESLASVVAALPNIAIAVGDPFDATPEQMRFAAAVVAGSFETGDWDRPRTARKLLDIATARAAGGQE